ncbi:hypothetical protein FAI40_04110 [Acetobacteraceae bacterium]|nr:hypothetical protein FAI40_04110 [Acetobacteraceae bacterium]
MLKFKCLPLLFLLTGCVYATAITQNVTVNVYVQKNKDGEDYNGKVVNSKRESTQQPTQKEAIEEMKRMHPDATVLVQRTRHLQNKSSPDKERKNSK